MISKDVIKLLISEYQREIMNTRMIERDYEIEYGLNFYVPEIQIAVQVCYNLSDIETRKREINGLLQLAKRLEIKKMLIITKDEEQVILENGAEIEVAPIWKWLIHNL